MWSMMVEESAHCFWSRARKGLAFADSASKQLQHAEQACLVKDTPEHSHRSTLDDQYDPLLQLHYMQDPQAARLVFA